MSGKDDKSAATKLVEDASKYTTGIAYNGKRYTCVSTILAKASSVWATILEDKDATEFKLTNDKFTDDDLSHVLEWLHTPFSDPARINVLDRTRYSMYYYMGCKFDIPRLLEVAQIMAANDAGPDRNARWLDYLFVLDKVKDASSAFGLVIPSPKDLQAVFDSKKLGDFTSTINELSSSTQSALINAWMKIGVDYPSSPAPSSPAPEYSHGFGIKRPRGSYGGGRGGGRGGH